MNDWNKERAQLEKELLDAKAVVSLYEATLKPYRTITDSEYREAKDNLWRVSTAIAESDAVANTPADPLEGLSKSDLQSLHDEEVAQYRGGAGSTRQLTRIMEIKRRIDDYEADEK